jgi:putative phage-type endonuclease
MKIIDFQQGSEEWLKWRRSVITATDASVIMGVNPHCTLNELRSRKLGLISEIECNAAMQRGKDLEGEARDKFNKDKGMSMETMIVESSSHPFLGASLDGFQCIWPKLECIEKEYSRPKIVLEIKCPLKKGMDEAKRGVVKPLYIAQMQHQLLVTGADLCYYYCFDGKEGHTIEVYADLKWQKEYLPKAEEFWMSLIFKE